MDDDAEKRLQVVVTGWETQPWYERVEWDLAVIWTVLMVGMGFLIWGAYMVFGLWGAGVLIGLYGFNVGRQLWR